MASNVEHLKHAQKVVEAKKLGQIRSVIFNEDTQKCG